MRHILVTGCDGFIGGSIFRYLKNAGFRVTGITRRDASDDKIQMDLSSNEQVIFDDIPADIEYVVHAAANVPVKAGDNTDANAEITRAIDRNVALLCSSRELPVFYFSSGPMYDHATADVKTEDSALKPPSPYHEAKKEGEAQFSALKEAIIARMSSPYGEHSSPAAVLKIFLAKAYSDQAIEVWGSGLREQDFIHEDDVARFVEKAIVKKAGGVFNLASGEPITMKELADTVVRVCSRGRVVMNNDGGAEEMSYARYSIQKAADTLEWSPSVTLEDGLKSIVRAWMYERT